MVLEYARAFQLSLALGVLAFPAGAQQERLGEDVLLTEARLAGRSVRLVDHGGICAVTLGKRETPALLTNLAAPCGFIRREGEDKPQSFNYGAAITVTFISGPPGRDGCADAGQSLKLDGSTFTLGEARSIAGVFCHVGGFDEVVFRMEAGVE